MRRRKITKIAAVSLALSLCVGTLAGCGKKNGTKKNSEDLYTVLQEAQDITTGEFEMTLGMVSEEDDSVMELILNGVSAENSFDIEMILNIESDSEKYEGTVTRMIYEEEHLYVNMANALEYVGADEEMSLSDLGIESDYIDIYVGDLFEQTENTAAGEMGELLLEMLEDAAVATDKEEGAGEDGSVEFKDNEVVAFIGNFAESLKDNMEDIIDLSMDSSNVSYDYDDILDYYEDALNECGVDMDEIKSELESVEEIEISEEEKETMITEMETVLDEVISSAEEVEEGAADGSKFMMEASLDGKKGSRTFECNFELVAAEEDAEEAKIYFNYLIEEGEGKVEVPEDSVEVTTLLEMMAPLLANPENDDPMDPTTDPTGSETKLTVNADGSIAMGCTYSCEYPGRVDVTLPEGYVMDNEFSDPDMLFVDDAEGNSLYVTIYEGNDYLNNYDYTSTKEAEPEAPTGTVSTPMGDMEYIISGSQTDGGYWSIYGFIIVDAEHYLEIDYTIYSSNGPSEEKIVNELTKIAQGLKAAQ